MGIELQYLVDHHLDGERPTHLYCLQLQSTIRSVPYLHQRKQQMQSAGR